MRVLLVDADSVIPNLALMKLSMWHKGLGAVVDFRKLNIPYYPTRRRRYHKIETEGYDFVFCSVVFDGSFDWITFDDDSIMFGGTGVDLVTILPETVEASEPDYSLYPDNDISYGFISRGCIRKCPFCKVPQKEGHIRQVNNIEDIVRHKKVKFMDNNFLALPNHKELLRELIDKKIKHQFNQGLDIRLVTPENSSLLAKLNYLGEYIFALDNVKDIYRVAEKLKMMSWRKDWQFKFFVYTHPDMTEADIVKRIEFLKKEKCLPYIMRHISCFTSAKNGFYVDLAAWCNQPGIFKKMDFKEFLGRRHQTKNRGRRIASSWKLYCG